MEYILNKPNIAQKILGPQKINSKTKYRSSVYCKTYFIDNKLLAFNLLTKQLIALSSDTEKNFFKATNFYTDQMDILIKNWFLVPDEFDDKTVFEQLYNILPLLLNKAGESHFSLYTILPTTACNAKCNYCFEEGAQVYSMTEQLAADTADFIMKNSIENGKINLRWFGGEPLCNYKAIDIISNRLNENKIDFDASMVSNSSLFNEELINNAKNNWHLKHVQVTIDGTENNYNRIKAYSDNKFNYQNVIKNIECLLKNDIKVLCRLNMDKYNYSDLILLTDELCNLFADYENFFIAPHIIYRFKNGVRLMGDMDTIEKFLDLRRYVFSKGKLHTRDYGAEFKNHNCMADCDTAVVILPNGDLEKCDSNIIPNFNGNIYNQRIDKDMINKYKVRNDDPNCTICPLKPVCIKIKNCPNTQSLCFEDKIFLENNLKYWVLNKYNDYKKKLN